MEEVLELRILDSLGNMKCNWYSGEWVLLNKLVVLPKGVEECFFVAQVIIALQMVVHFQFTAVLNEDNTLFLQEASQSSH